MAILSKTDWRRVRFLTNNTFDADVDPYPLSDRELRYMTEFYEFSAKGTKTPHDICGGHGATWNGRKYHAVAVEFHFRNDATRAMWGSAELETQMPLPTVVEP